MLKCRDITLLASDYVDGRLRWRKRLSLLLHLITCPHCRRFIQQFRVLVQVIKGYEPEQPSPALISQCDAAVDRAIDAESRATNAEHGNDSTKNDGE